MATRVNKIQLPNNRELYGLSSTQETTINSVENGAQVNTVTGVKGNSEVTYRVGNINLTTANIGAEPIINPAASNPTTQYWRGDKTWQILDKNTIGLSNVDNTSDINKPISTATQNALNLKVDQSGSSYKLYGTSTSGMQVIYNIGHIYKTTENISNTTYGISTTGYLVNKLTPSTLAPTVNDFILFANGYLGRVTTFNPTTYTVNTLGFGTREHDNITINLDDSAKLQINPNYIDYYPQNGSDNLITSGGVWQETKDLSIRIDNVENFINSIGSSESINVWSAAAPVQMEEYELPTNVFTLLQGNGEYTIGDLVILGYGLGYISGLNFLQDNDEITVTGISQSIGSWRANVNWDLGVTDQTNLDIREFEQRTGVWGTANYGDIVYFQNAIGMIVNYWSNGSGSYSIPVQCLTLSETPVYNTQTVTNMDIGTSGNYDGELAISGNINEPSADLYKWNDEMADWELYSDPNSVFILQTKGIRNTYKSIINHAFYGENLLLVSSAQAPIYSRHPLKTTSNSDGTQNLKINQASISSSVVPGKDYSVARLMGNLRWDVAGLSIFTMMRRGTDIYDSPSLNWMIGSNDNIVEMEIWPKEYAGWTMSIGGYGDNPETASTFYSNLVYIKIVKTNNINGQWLQYAYVIEYGGSVYTWLIPMDIYTSFTVKYVGRSDPEDEFIVKYITTPT